MRLVSLGAHSQTFWKTSFPSDREIVDRILAGELPLFEVLMRRHNQRIYRAIRAILRNETEVEDVMQQTYVSAYGNLKQFAGTAKFSTWLTKIAVNEALARIRRAARYPLSHELPLPGDEATMRLATDQANPEERTGVRELMGMLESAMDSLPESSRSVVMLREIEGMSTAEAAEVLGVTEDVVKTRLLRARRHMRRILTQKIGLHVEEAFPFYAPRCDRIVARVLIALEVKKP